MPGEKGGGEGGGEKRPRSPGNSPPLELRSRIGEADAEAKGGEAGDGTTRFTNTAAAVAADYVPSEPIPSPSADAGTAAGAKYSTTTTSSSSSNNNLTSPQSSLGSHLTTSPVSLVTPLEGEGEGEGVEGDEGGLGGGGKGGVDEQALRSVFTDIPATPRAAAEEDSLVTDTAATTSVVGTVVGSGDNGVGDNGVGHAATLRAGPHEAVQQQEQGEASLPASSSAAAAAAVTGTAPTTSSGTSVSRQFVKMRYEQETWIALGDVFFILCYFTSRRVIHEAKRFAPFRA